VEVAEGGIILGVPEEEVRVAEEIEQDGEG
jgi:hypothetical protein